MRWWIIRRRRECGGYNVGGGGSLEVDDGGWLRVLVDTGGSSLEADRGVRPSQVCNRWQGPRAVRGCRRNLINTAWVWSEGDPLLGAISLLGVMLPTTFGT